MINNVCIFRKITHVQSGKELEVSYLESGTIIETYELNGPKLILEYRDDQEYVKNTLKIKEFDEISVSYGDTWQKGGVSESETFVVLTVTPKAGNIITINALAKTVYEMKQVADKTRIFANRGIIDIAKAVLLGGIKKFDFGKFPVVENYHVLAGERPAQTLKQMADEQGSHIWYCRGGIHMKKFAEMFKQEPSLTLHHGRAFDDYQIMSYTAPSEQMAAQEKNVRSFTGWDEKLGRIKTSPQSPFLKGASSTPMTQTGSASPFILGNSPVATKTAIDMVTVGKLSIEPGQTLKLMWHLPDPSHPINEGLPPKVVVSSVSHWYSAQKYYCRVKGAVELVPA